MNYRVDRTEDAQTEIRALSPQPRAQVNKALRDLRKNYRAGDTKKLDGFDTLWRVRIGRRRIVFQLNPRARVVTVLRVRRREIVYDDLVEPPLPH